MDYCPTAMQDNLFKGFYIELNISQSFSLIHRLTLKKIPSLPTRSTEGRPDERTAHRLAGRSADCLPACLPACPLNMADSLTVS